MWQYTSTSELYHHGIIGQKWGVRRYQNKDGTLTEAGKKRAAKLQREYNDLTGKSVRKSPAKEAKAAASKQKTDAQETAKTDAPAKPKTLSELSNAEIQARIDRIALEQRYTQALASINPKQVSRGQQFMNNFKDQAVNTISKGAAEALGDVAKAALTKALKSSLGLSGGDNKKK